MRPARRVPRCDLPLYVRDQATPPAAAWKRPRRANRGSFHAWVSSAVECRSAYAC